MVGRIYHSLSSVSFFSCVIISARIAVLSNLMTPATVIAASNAESQTAGGGLQRLD